MVYGMEISGMEIIEPKIPQVGIIFEVLFKGTQERDSVYLPGRRRLPLPEELPDGNSELLDRKSTIQDISFRN